MDENLEFEYGEGQSFLPPDMTQNSLVCSILNCILGVVGLIGNSLMLRAWIKYPKLRNDFYTLFAALSVADILFLLISVPANVIDIMVLEEFNTVAWCKASRYLVHACGFVAAYLLVALATLRAILLTNRNTIPRPRAKHMVIVSLVSYVVVFLISIPIISMHTSHSGFCFFYSDVNVSRQIWLLNSFSTIVPLILVFILYFVTYMLGKRFFADSYSVREKQRSRLVNSVVIAFTVCQLPYRIFSLYENYLNWDKLSEKEAVMIYSVKDYLMCLLIASKVIRPILYSKLTSDLKHAFDEIINCQCFMKSYQRAENPLIESTATECTLPTISAPATMGSSVTSPEQRKGEGDLEHDTQASASNPCIGLSDSDSGFGRSLSTSSTASSGSQAPLVRNQSLPSEIEMI